MPDIPSPSTDILAVIASAKGFMPDDEGQALHDAAAQVSVEGAWFELGTYCGKSALWLGAAAASRGALLFTLDHHRGSEEMQQGWEHHDLSLVDESGRFDSLFEFRRNIATAGLEESVVGIIGQSLLVAEQWASPLGFLFIDGGHAKDVAHGDYDAWVKHLVGGATLCIHDVFENPEDGGRPPYELYLRALDDGFTETSRCGSLRTLKRS